MADEAVVVLDDVTVHEDTVECHSTEEVYGDRIVLIIGKHRYMDHLGASPVFTVHVDVGDTLNVE